MPEKLKCHNETSGFTLLSCQRMTEELAANYPCREISCTGAKFFGSVCTAQLVGYPLKGTQPKQQDQQQPATRTNYKTVDSLQLLG